MKIEDIRAEYRKLIDENIESNRTGALALCENTERSDLYFRGHLTSKTLQIPRIYTKDTIIQFQNIVKIAYSIFVKVINEYLKSKDYRSLFGFSEELEKLILIPNGYNSLLPIARFDIFYHEETGEFYFCEINTDGSSGMNEDRLLDIFMINNPAHQEMRRRYHFKTMELFDSWVNTFLRLYSTYEHCVTNPNVAIIDFLDRGTVREFEEFARHFQKAGINCEICDIRKLQFKNGKLYSPSGHIVDAVYRRAVTTDILDYIEEVRDFIEAVNSNACFIAGSLCTQIIHHKKIFYVLHLPQTKRILTQEENSFIEKHIPYTVPFSREYIDLSEVIKNKNKYILKPEDSYASKGVYAGIEYEQDIWEEFAKISYEKGYICQEYCKQHISYNIDFAWGDGKWHSYIDMTGLFVYNGELAGIFSRSAEGNGIIASNRNERTQATYIVEQLLTN